MSDPHNKDVAHLQKVNTELNRSLERCRDLVAECRSRLAANSNDPVIFDNDDEEAGESDRA